MQDASDESFIAHSLQSLIALVTRLKLIDVSVESHDKLIIAFHSVGCLASALRGMIFRSPRSWAYRRQHP